jgi:hypothetical protein
MVITAKNQPKPDILQVNGLPITLKFIAETASAEGDCESWYPNSATNTNWIEYMATLNLVIRGRLPTLNIIIVVASAVSINKSNRLMALFPLLLMMLTARQ